MPEPAVIVVGAGIAGVTCARELAAAGVPVELRERSYVVGGRMASRTLHGRRVDLGASYFTCRSPEFGTVVADWQARGLVRPWTDLFAVRTPAGWDWSSTGPMRYGSAGGLRSLVEDLATGLTLVPRTEVADVGPGPTVDGVKVSAVVLAMPDQQASDLLADELAEEIELTVDSESEPTLSLAAGWPERCWREVPGAFVQDDPVIDWVADDGSRRGDGAPVLVAHTTAEFAASRLDAPQEATEAVLDGLLRVMEVDERPEWTHLHRWSLARPAAGRDQPFHLGESMIGICGDGWGSPRVETAWASGRALGRALVERLA